MLFALDLEIELTIWDCHACMAQGKLSSPIFPEDVVQLLSLHELHIISGSSVKTVIFSHHAVPGRRCEGAGQEHA